MSLDKFKSSIAASVVDSPESFICEEEGGILRWTWNKDARKACLTDLLSRYYADFYEEGSRFFLDYCKPVITHLANDPSDRDLLSWAEEEGSEVFYPMDGWYRAVTVNGKEFNVHVSLVSLSSEGKVMFEEMEQHLSFFEKALRKAYADNPLGKCLTVDVG